MMIQTAFVTTLIVAQAMRTTIWTTTSFALTPTTALVALPLHLRKRKLGALGLDCFCSLQLRWQSLWRCSSKRNKRSGTKFFPCRQQLHLLQNQMRHQHLTWKKASQSHPQKPTSDRSGNQPQNEKFPRNRQFTCRKSNYSRFK